MANATETKFGDPATRLAQTAHWTVLLRPRQPTLASLVLVCREPALAFSELSVDAFADLGRVVRGVEGALKAVTEYERINYLMLMMVDRDVHFHVIPRYAGTRKFMEREFPDTGWPGAPALEPVVALEDHVREALLSRLRQAFQRTGL